MSNPDELDPFDLEDELDDLYFDGEELDGDALYALFDVEEYEALEDEAEEE